MQSINAQKFERELKKGGAELLVLSLLEARPRHGYELRKLIETRSDGALKFNAASLIYCFTGWKSAAGSKAGGWRKPGNGGDVFTN